MKQALTDTELDALLRRDFVAATVPDDGFSTRVLRALPPRRRKRAWLLPVAALVGALLAWLTLLPAAPWLEVLREWATEQIPLSAWVVWALLFGTGLLGCAWAVEEAE